MKTIKTFWVFLGLMAIMLLSISFADKSKEKMDASSGENEIFSDSGIIVMAHGGSSLWNQLVRDAVKPLERRYTVEIAFGMANPKTLKQAIDRLENRGVKHIAVIPLFISSYSPIIEQAKYLLGIDTSFPSTPMIMLMDRRLKPYWELRKKLPWWLQVTIHKEELDNEQLRKFLEPYLADDIIIDSFINLYNLRKNLYKQMLNQIKPLGIRSKIYFGHPLDSDTIVARILLKRIKAISQEPSKEAVVLVAHGPNAEDNNRKWLQEMEKLSLYIKQHSQEVLGSEVALIMSTTVRDDAPEPIYEQAKTNLRAIVRQLNNNGYRVLVVPLLLASGGIEEGIWERLKGLEYVPSRKMLLPDSLISLLLLQRVEEVW